MGTALINQNSIKEENTSRLKPGNACYQSVQNLLSSSLLTKNLRLSYTELQFCETVLHGCKTWLLTLREERKLKVFENKVLRRIFGPKRDVVTGG